MQHESETFGEIQLEVGGKRFINCAFNRTTLVYTSGATPIFAGEKTVFNGVNFEFAGEGWEAFNYVRLLRLLFGKDFLEELLDVPGKTGGRKGH